MVMEETRIDDDEHDDDDSGDDDDDDGAMTMVKTLVTVRTKTMMIVTKMMIVIEMAMTMTTGRRIMSAMTIATIMLMIKNYVNGKDDDVDSE